MPGIIRIYLEEFIHGRRYGESFSDFWGRRHKPEEGPHWGQFHLAPDVPRGINPYTIGL
jgi:hypothetical protein